MSAQRMLAPERVYVTAESAIRLSTTMPIRTRYTHLEHVLVLLGHEVDGDTLAAETAAATNAVQVVLWLRRQVEVDDQRHLHGGRCMSERVAHVGLADTKQQLQTMSTNSSTTRLPVCL